MRNRIDMFTLDDSFKDEMRRAFEKELDEAEKAVTEDEKKVINEKIDKEIKALQKELEEEDKDGSYRELMGTFLDDDDDYENVLMAFAGVDDPSELYEGTMTAEEEAELETWLDDSTVNMDFMTAEQRKTPFDLTEKEDKKTIELEMMAIAEGDYEIPREDENGIMRGGFKDAKTQAKWEAIAEKEMAELMS